MPTQNTHTLDLPQTSVTLCSFLHQLAKNGKTLSGPAPSTTDPMNIHERGRRPNRTSVRASLTLHHPSHAHIIGLFRKGRDTIS
ncbi:hypothetical protein QQF64_017108 [Cirrhinus molitorella]|uniref:Uncharacterized protein n=1 Tax=Cirrhinus molitorella TaxID=172907 RepID=A0ABR3LJC8_9TELE